MDNEPIYKKWEWDKQYITSCWISDHSPHGLRWIIRNGEKVLQQELFVRVEFSTTIWKRGDFTTEDSGYVWFDVPTEEE